MRITVTQPLFAWECLDDSPSLATLGELLASIPDGRLLEALRIRRGNGRDDYPVHVLWGVLRLTVALRHFVDRGLPGRTAPQPRPAAADRHRVGSGRAQGLEHVAVRGSLGRRAVPHAGQGDLQPDDPAAGEGGAGPGPGHGGRRHQA